MDKTQIYNKLVYREEYDPTIARIVIKEIDNIDEVLKEALMVWIEDASRPICQVRGINTEKLVRSGKFNYLTAILNLNWILDEPDIALPIIKGLLNSK